MTDYITIDVDGLPVDVDEAQYDADEDGTIAAVRAARAGRVGDAGGHEPGPDYDELVAAFGEAE
jgi:hypothetical protein